MKNIYDFPHDELAEYLISKGEKAFRATQLFEWLYKQQITSLDEINNIKKTLLSELADEFILPRLEVASMQEASDGTVKFLFRLYDGALIETVLMRQYYGNSVCVTTQVGCNMGCLFCASGQTKRIRNLSAGEIVLQALEVSRYLQARGERLSHIVIMGIGEPFDNYKNVIKFLKIVNHPKGLDIGARHMTVSTCGIVSKIIEFSEFSLQINLAISLHFPNDEKRSKYMKINRAYPLKDLIDAVRYYEQKTNRKVTFEYIMLKGVNDSLEDADELARLVKGIHSVINLIPYNETEIGLYRSSDEQTKRFYDRLKKHRLNVTIRKELGHDIDAACGQLRVKKMKESR